MTVAKYLGLPVAEVETATVAGRDLLVVTRYDRLVDPSGSVDRIHQEDLCQATGTPPVSKYQDNGGPSLRQVAAILQVTDPTSLETLLRAITLHVVIGNGDAHGKNYSLLHDSSGAVRLAPLYDLMSTQVYGDDQLAMHIDDVRRLSRVTFDRIVNEATAWGLSRPRASTVVREVLETIPDAADRAAAVVDPPEELTRCIAAQLGVVRSTGS